jgi:hypothetical protein
MKKKVFLLFTLLVLLTGCEITDIEKKQIDTVIDEALQSNNSTNEIYNGYKYYLPNGMKIIDKNDDNTKILFKNDYYYLFVDMVSYYHKTKVEYTADESKYFSKAIRDNGYIEIIDNKDDTYHIKIEYNYSKIEGIVSKDNIKQGIYNSLKILGSIKYNDLIIESSMGENALNYKEEEFNLFESQREEGSYLDYIEEYDVKEEDNKKKDDDYLS